MRIVASFVLLAVSVPGQAASFDCTKAATATEKLICGNQRISDLDEYLGRYYLTALAELDPLQLGANALKNEDLPDVKALVWVIGPELDKVAAPPPKTHEPLVVTGKIFNDMEGGNGFMIQDAKGRKFILLPAMFIDKPNYMRFESLTQEEPRIYEARGEAEPSGDGQVHFAPGACRLIYRLPK